MVNPSLTMEDKVRPLHPYSIPTRVLTYSVKVTTQSREAGYSRIYHDIDGCFFYPGPCRGGLRTRKILQRSYNPYNRCVATADYDRPPACCSLLLAFAPSLIPIPPSTCRPKPVSNCSILIIETRQRSTTTVSLLGGPKQKGKKKKKKPSVQFHTISMLGAPDFTPSRDAKLCFLGAGG
jgi:hypothetical protein